MKEGSGSLASCSSAMLWSIWVAQLTPSCRTEYQDRLPRAMLDDERHKLLVQLLAKRPVAPVVPIDDLGERDGTVILTELLVSATAPLHVSTPKAHLP